MSTITYTEGIRISNCLPGIIIVYRVSTPLTGFNLLPRFERNYDPAQIWYPNLLKLWPRPDLVPLEVARARENYGPARIRYPRGHKGWIRGKTNEEFCLVGGRGVLARCVFAGFSPSSAFLQRLKFWGSRFSFAWILASFLLGLPSFWPLFFSSFRLSFFLSSFRRFHFSFGGEGGLVLIIEIIIF